MKQHSSMKIVKFLVLLLISTNQARPGLLDIFGSITMDEFQKQTLEKIYDKKVLTNIEIEDLSYCSHQEEVLQDYSGALCVMHALWPEISANMLDPLISVSTQIDKGDFSSYRFKSIRRDTLRNPVLRMFDQDALDLIVDKLNADIGRKTIDPEILLFYLSATAHNAEFEKIIIKNKPMIPFFTRAKSAKLFSRPIFETIERQPITFCAKAVRSELTDSLSFFGPENLQQIFTAQDVSEIYTRMNIVFTIKNAKKSCSFLASVVIPNFYKLPRYGKGTVKISVFLFMPKSTCSANSEQALEAGTIFFEYLTQLIASTKKVFDQIQVDGQFESFPTIDKIYTTSTELKGAISTAIVAQTSD